MLRGVLPGTPRQKFASVQIFRNEAPHVLKYNKIYFYSAAC